MSRVHDLRKIGRQSLGAATTTSAAGSGRTAAGIANAGTTLTASAAKLVANAGATLAIDTACAARS